jgi:hypothetical protein
MNKNLAFGLCLLLAACGSQIPKDLPPEVVSVAFAQCATDVCTDVSVGPTTRKLPWKQDGGLLGRWCVEVQFKMNGQAGKMAVDVGNLVFQDAGWHAAPAVMDADCTVFDNATP